MEILIPVAIFSLALAIVIAALILRSVVTAMITTLQQATTKQVAGLAEKRQSLTALTEALSTISKTLGGVDNSLQNLYYMYDREGYRQLDKLINALRDGCTALEKLVPAEQEHGKEQ